MTNSTTQSLFFIIIQQPTRTTLFPYTTLFRSRYRWYNDYQLPASYDDQVITVRDRKSTRLNSSHVSISYAVFCLKKKKSEFGVHRPLQLGCENFAKARRSAGNPGATPYLSSIE